MMYFKCLKETALGAGSISIDLRLQQPWHLHILKPEGITVSKVVSGRELTIAQVQTTAPFLF